MPPLLQVLSSQLHRLWRKFDRKVMQRVFGGRDMRMPPVFQSVAELNSTLLQAQSADSQTGDQIRSQLPTSSLQPHSTAGRNDILSGCASSRPSSGGLDTFCGAAPSRESVACLACVHTPLCRHGLSAGTPVSAARQVVVFRPKQSHRNLEHHTSEASQTASSIQSRVMKDTSQSALLAVTRKGCVCTTVAHLVHTTTEAAFLFELDIADFVPETEHTGHSASVCCRRTGRARGAAGAERAPLRGEAQRGV